MANATYRARGTNSTGAPVSIDVVTDDGTSDANAKTFGQALSTLLGTGITMFKADGTVIAKYTPAAQGTTVSCVTLSTASAI